jgi:hypothetical protein
MGNENRLAWFFKVARPVAGLALSRYFTLRPPGLRPRTRRNRLADGLFELFLLLSRCTVVAGAILGGAYTQTRSFKWSAIGLIVGWAVGFWIRFSLGMRSLDLKHGFYVRLLERGNGSRTKLLEYLVEKLRGNEFSASQCRIAAGAYAELQRQLRVCISPAERYRLTEGFEQKVMMTLYGKRAATSRGETKSASETVNGSSPVHGGSILSIVPGKQATGNGAEESKGISSDERIIPFPTTGREAIQISAACRPL